MNDLERLFDQTQTKIKTIKGTLQKVEKRFGVKVSPTPNEHSTQDIDSLLEALETSTLKSESLLEELEQQSLISFYSKYRAIVLDTILALPCIAAGIIFQFLGMIPFLIGVSVFFVIGLLLIHWLSSKAGSKAKHFTLQIKEQCMTMAHVSKSAKDICKAELVQKRGEEAERRDQRIAKVETEAKKNIDQLKNQYQKDKTLLETQWKEETETLKVDYQSQKEPLLKEKEELLRHYQFPALEALNQNSAGELHTLHEQFSKSQQGISNQWHSSQKEFHDYLQKLKFNIQQKHQDWNEQQLQIDHQLKERTDIPLGQAHVQWEVSKDDEGQEKIIDNRCQINLPQLDFPIGLNYPECCSLLIESWGDQREKGINILNNTMMRLLVGLPSGKVSFTILDPVGLGQSFASFMHLADEDETLIDGRIWSESRHIEERLANLSEHMEKVIQKYLRSDYENLAQYNLEAGEVAEKIRFLVIADFPESFSDIAIQRLKSILNSGPRCGVYTLIHRDLRQKLPKDFPEEELKHSNTFIVTQGEEHFYSNYDKVAQLKLELETTPEAPLQTQLLKTLGEYSRESSKVEVPFEVITPNTEEIWSKSSAKGFEVPLGRSGANRLQYLALGKGTSQHTLIAGKTGSGKSTLFHVLITGACMWYSPEELEVYLIDFKKGVEFKAYANRHLPHARAIAIESDREFGLSVLQKVDRELKDRGELFRSLGVQDLASYRNTDSKTIVPRTILLIDEFQELFVQDDRLSQDAAMLLDRIVRQGRAFGIHVILGSQTLGGAYSLARSTMGQMGVRIALQCSEADSYMILSEDNAAARLLTRPGEAIYNDAAGMIEGNSPFQVVWLSDEQKDHALAQIEDKPHAMPDPIIFEGNAPAKLDQCHNLLELYRGKVNGMALEPRLWLGEANAIKGPTEIRFRGEAGEHVLIVGQRTESAFSIFLASLMALTRQQPGARFSIVLSNESDPWLPHLDRFLELCRATVNRYEIQDLSKLMEECHQDRENNTKSKHFIFLFGLQRMRELRTKDDFSFSVDEGPPGADKVFMDILKEGSEFGYHIVAWCDTLANVHKTISRQNLREFSQRILMQMSAADSGDLMDSPQASQLGLHRALLYDEREGVVEKFRPWEIPNMDWIQQFQKDNPAPSPK